jgi:hypothetical protein
VIICTSLSSSGFFTFLATFPLISIIALIAGDRLRRVARIFAALAICASIYVPLNNHNPGVFQETFGFFGALSEQPTETLASAVAPQPAPRRAHTDVGIQRLSFGSGESGEPLASSAALAGTSESPQQEGLPTPEEIMSLVHEQPPAAVAAGSGRLYIWRESLKLIAASPIFGYGMDTMTYVFPQRDINKISGMGIYNIMVTKPHDIYIGYAFGAGIPALLLFLAAAALSVVWFVRYMLACRRPKSEPAQSALPSQAAAAALPAETQPRGVEFNLAAVAFMCGWFAYLVQGFVNDDLVSTAPIWWALAGMAIGTIRMSMRPQG